MSCKNCYQANSPSYISSVSSLPSFSQSSVSNSYKPFFLFSSSNSIPSPTLNKTSSTNYSTPFLLYNQKDSTSLDKSFTLKKGLGDDPITQYLSNLISDKYRKDPPMLALLPINNPKLFSTPEKFNWL